jgi:hypothetical protein
MVLGDTLLKFPPGAGRSLQNLTDHSPAGFSQLVEFQALRPRRVDAGDGTRGVKKASTSIPCGHRRAYRHCSPHKQGPS